MSDDARSAPKGPRRTKPRILILANPDGSDDESKPYDDYNYQQPPYPSTSQSYLPGRIQNANPPLPPPLHTDLTEHRHCYPSSRSNPALSSPSSTSSPAVESTPPPSTPGQSQHSIDLSEGTLRQEHIPPAISDRPDGPSKYHRSHDRVRPQPPRPNNSSQTSLRPATSPVVSTTPDSVNSHSTHQPRSSPEDFVTIMVTTDAETMKIVDITGAPNAAFIRERIFTKLEIPDEDQFRYSIYRTEIRQYAIGDALTDDQLFELCRERGDAAGTIKLFVSLTQASVHEDRFEDRETTSSMTIPPPVLPPHQMYAPLRPKRPSKSRRGSLSSASEKHPPEANTGYDASVSDDLDHSERRNPVRPLPQRSSPVQPPPRPRSPGTFKRPSSPSNVLSPDRPQAQSPDAHSARSDRTQYLAMHTSPTARHSPQNSQGGQVDAAEHYWRPHHDQDSPQKNDAYRRKESDSRREGSKLKRTKAQHATGEDRRDARTAGPSSLSPSELRERHNALQDVRPAPPPHHQTSPTAFPIPQHPRGPPPAPPGSSSSGRRGHNMKAAPRGWLVTWRATQDTTDQQPSSTYRPMAAKSMNNLRDAYKQHQHSVPISLQPGRSGKTNPPQLPVSSRPATSSSVTSGGMAASTSEATSPPSAEYADVGLPKSYEGTRGGTYSPIRSHHSRTTTNPPAYSSSTNAGSYLSLTPTQEPYPRPRSAIGEPSGSPYRSNRPLQSPRATDFPHNVSTQQSPQPMSSQYVSPTMTSQPSATRDDRPYPSNLTSMALGPRPSPHHQPYSEGHNVDYNSYHSNLPRTLPTPHNSSPGLGSPPDSRLSDRRPLDQIPIQRTLTSSLPVQEDDPSEHTVRREDYARIFEAIGQRSEPTIPQPPPRKVPSPPRPRSPPRSSPTPQSALSNGSRTIIAPSSHEATSTLIDFPSTNDEESDSDGTLWIVKPQNINGDSQVSWSSTVKPSTRPVLAPISTDNSPSSHAAALPNASFSQEMTVNLPQPPNYIPEMQMNRPRKKPSLTYRRNQDPRMSISDNNADYTWAPRPPVEEVVENMHNYFPEHDVDKPVLDAPSGGGSPTSPEHPTLLPQADRRFRHKKSIRVVAAEHKRRVDRTSHMEPANTQSSLRKRNTKLWGSKLEEVTSDQAKGEFPMSSEPSPGGGGAKPIFRWVRGQLIGKGTYGKVYLALNATTGEMIAVKQVEVPRTASDKDDRRQVSVVEALKLESETLKDLDHPNIVQYLGFEETPSFLSIFLEYVPGGSIASCLRKYGKFNEDVTKSFTMQILGGLEYLHSKGILHRDLKADNILVETSGVCKISDFGISKRTDDIDMAGIHTSMQGTVFWMAPEVINSHKGGYNSKIDIWSVGCVVFEMWTGQRPWSGEEVVAVLLKVAQTKQGPPVPPNVVLSPLADDFRRKCFAMDPDERPSASELQKHPYLTLPPDWTFPGFESE